MPSTLEDYLAIDIRKLKDRLDHQQFTIRWTQLDETIATMQVEATPDRLLVNGHPIHLTYTPCHLGGQRAWFLCPGCEGRFAKLYWSDGFRCRTCLGVPYACTLETDLDRIIRKQRRINNQLCGKMRRQKRIRLWNEWQACEEYISKQFEPMLAKIQKIETSWSGPHNS